MQFELLDDGTSRPSTVSSSISLSEAKFIEPVRCDESRPVPTTGGRMVYSPEHASLYLFGGQNGNAETVNDFWKYELENKSWVKLNPLGETPSPRSGHSLILSGKKILLFGGLLEITQECNDTFRYCIQTNTFVKLDTCPQNSTLSHSVFHKEDQDQQISPAIYKRNTFIVRNNKSTKELPRLKESPSDVYNTHEKQKPVPARSRLELQ